VKLVGLSGYARSGKDTVAEILVEQCGYQRVAFADKLRQALYELNPVVGHENEMYGLLGLVYLQDIIDEYGWDGVKSTRYGPEVRRLLQRLGTEAGRNVLGNNIWVDAALNDLDDQGRYVFTDCRFVNEATAITELGGQVWRVNRPGVGPANDHISEIGLDDWNFDFTVSNDGTIQQLSDRVWLRAHRV
jgi:hypothetical protein